MLAWLDFGRWLLVFTSNYYIWSEVKFYSSWEIYIGGWFRQAWNKLGAMPPEEAMQKYIDIVTELYPSWIAGSSMVRSNPLKSILPVFKILWVSIWVGPIFCAWICRRAKAVKVMHQLQRPKDRWGQFLAHLCMRNLELSRKLLVLLLLGCLL